MKKACVGYCAFLIAMACNQAWAVDFSSAQTKVTGGNAVSIWVSTDAVSGLPIVRGAKGPVGDPSSWSTTTISFNEGSVQYTTPVLISNANGDVMGMWQWPNVDTGLYTVEGAVLPAGASSWTTATLSGGDAGYFDQTGSIDESGNILAFWSAWNPDLGQVEVHGCTGAIVSGVVTINPEFVPTP